jgi:alkaline phosphatase
VTKAKNVILMIGDGMGPTQIEAGSLYRNAPLTMQKFPYMTTVETCSASDKITDSAAAATALATGVRTRNGLVGKDLRGNELETIVDIAASLGKRTGVIATEEIFGATPMGFSGHSDARGDTHGLLTTASESSNVNFFACSSMGDRYKNYFVDAGYLDVPVADNISETKEEKVVGVYNIHPWLDPMSARGSIVAFDRLVTEALEYLSQDEDGFFLMAEGSHIDHGGHQNDFVYMMDELLSFDDGVKAVLEWAKDRDDTVVIVTADHETGGLLLAGDATHEDVVKAYAGEADYAYRWTTTGHTDTDVNLYINGANIDFSQYAIDDTGRIRNIDVFQIMKSLM